MITGSTVARMWPNRVDMTPVAIVARTSVVIVAAVVIIGIIIDSAEIGWNFSACSRGLGSGSLFRCGVRRGWRNFDCIAQIGRLDGNRPATGAWGIAEGDVALFIGGFINLLGRGVQAQH